MRRQSARGQSLWDALASPGALLLAALFLVPLGMLVAFSFGTVDIVGRPRVGSTLANYDLVFQGYNLAVIVRTLLYAAATTAACLVVGYAVAYTAARFAGRFGAALIVLVVLPWLVDYLVRIYAWKQLLGDGGPVNGLLVRVGVGPVHWLGTGTAVVAGLIYGYLPMMILPIYAALTDLDTALIDAGKDLFGGPVATFFRVTLPSTVQGVIGGCLLVFLPTLGDFATAQFLGGPTTTMIGNIISDQYVETGSQTFGAALAVTLVVMLAVTVLIVGLVLRRRTSLTQAVVGS